MSEAWAAFTGIVLASVAAVAGWITVWRQRATVLHERKQRLRVEVEHAAAKSKLRKAEAHEKATTGLLDDHGKVLDEVNNGGVGTLTEYLTSRNKPGKPDF